MMPIKGSPLKYSETVWYIKLKEGSPEHNFKDIMLIDKKLN